MNNNTNWFEAAAVKFLNPLKEKKFDKEVDTIINNLWIDIVEFALNHFEEWERDYTLGLLTVNTGASNKHQHSWLVHNTPDEYQAHFQWNLEQACDTALQSYVEQLIDMAYTEDDYEDPLTNTGKYSPRDYQRFLTFYIMGNVLNRNAIRKYLMRIFEDYYDTFLVEIDAKS